VNVLPPMTVLMRKAPSAWCASTVPFTDAPTFKKRKN
jgi:hypothetical protein